MKIALIPARGGSKRIPKKNIKPFAGKPIIAYSIAAALKSGLFDRVIVSTDDNGIAEVAKKYGAEVPFHRPAEIANDSATTMDVIRHAIQWSAGEGLSLRHLCCLYATAPFIQAGDIAAGFDLLVTSGADYCFPVTSFPFPIQRAVKLRADGRLEMFQPEHLNTRSQDLPAAFHDAGQFYWGRGEAFSRGEPLFSSAAVPLILPRHRVQDIDTPEDWTRAELMYDLLVQRGEISP